MANFEWNDAIAKMNKANSLNRLLLRLRALWCGGRCNVNLYTPMRTLGMIDFANDNEITSFVTSYINGIDMLYIKSNFGEWNIYLDKYSTFRFVNSNDKYTTLYIEMLDDTEIKIKI